MMCLGIEKHLGVAADDGKCIKTKIMFIGFWGFVYFILFVFTQDVRVYALRIGMRCLPSLFNLLWVYTSVHNAFYRNFWLNKSYKTIIQSYLARCCGSCGETMYSVLSGCTEFPVWVKRPAPPRHDVDRQAACECLYVGVVLVCISV